MSAAGKPVLDARIGDWGLGMGHWGMGHGGGSGAWRMLLGVGFFSVLGVHPLPQQQSYYLGHQWPGIKGVGQASRLSPL